MRDFRTVRLGKLLANDGPHRLVPGALMVGHFVPTQATLGLVQVDPIPYIDQRTLPVLGANVHYSRVNLDGALAVRNPNAEGTHGYSQFFRNGYFETVQVLTYAGSARASFGSLRYEQEFISVLRILRNEFMHLGIGTEMTCMVSILGATHVQLGLDRFTYNLEDYQGFFDRDTLVLPDVLLPADLSPEQALRPVFDLVWQSAGLVRSANYNAAGEWAPPR
jgi:hypothetical protein